MTFNPLTPLEEATLDHIRTFLAEELHVYVTEDGHTVLDVTINPASGGPLSTKIGGMLAAGQKVRLLHNHPSEDSLSSSDWETLAHHHGMLETVVVTPNGSVYRGKVDYDFQAGDVLAAVKHHNSAYNMMHSMIHAPNISTRNPGLAADAGRLPNVFIGQRYYELGIVDFGAWFSTPDQYALADLQHEPIRHMWSAFLRRTWR